MTRTLVLAEWLRATEALLAAELLAREGYEADAISRAYYASLHAAKAALQVHGVGAESHAAVKRLFGLHLVKTGEIEAVWAAQLVESLDDRLAADYDVEIAFTAADARAECRRTRAFVRRIRRYLRAQKFAVRELATLDAAPGRASRKRTAR